MAKVVSKEETEKVLRWLERNKSYVDTYLASCKHRGVLPSCSDFFRVTRLGWDRVYRLSYSHITDYLRKRYKEG